MSNITVYHKDHCPYCKGAIKMLESHALVFTAIEVTDDPLAFNEMVSLSRRRTVPQIFFGDTHIGGFDDLQRYVSANPEFSKALQTGDATLAA